MLGRRIESVYLIHDDHFGFPEQGSGDAKELPLPGGDVLSSLAHLQASKLYIKTYK
jgi:hypothetical protein